MGTVARRSADQTLRRRWFDEEELKPGRDAQKALVSGLKASDIYALIIGKRSLSNPNVMFEIGVAAASDRPLIPIILEAGATPELIASFSHIQKVRTDDPNVAADELKRVAEGLRQSPPE